MKLVLSGNEPRQEYLWAELRRAVNVLAAVPFDDIDPLTKYLAALLSFSRARAQWWGNYQMHPLMQARRRRVLGQRLGRLGVTPDALLLWGSWFNPCGRNGTRGVRFFNYIDQSRSLEPLAGEPPASRSRRRRSYELQSGTYRDSSGIFCWSEWCRNQTLEAHPTVDPRKVMTVGWGPCGVDLSSESIDENAREPLVLHVSNDFHRKGVDFLIRTATRVKSAVSNARFVVIGKDSSGMRLTERNGVEFTGPIVDKDVLKDYFRKASVFLLPHRFDRSPHVLAEAMSAGLPIVTSEQGGPVEVARGTGAGFIHPVGDIEGYADSVVRVLRDPELRRSMGANARALMLDRYNWKSVAQKIVTAMQT
jgi:glycosyltransferase involved in cell wall biosynthesis